MSEIKAAMTAEEWAEASKVSRRLNELGVELYDDGDPGIYGSPDGGIQRQEQRHALAALALHKQPFGFTAEDVTLLRSTAHFLENQDGGRLSTAWPEGANPWRDTTAIRDLAARVAALLPPS